MVTLIDLHNHSVLSPDGCDLPVLMAERACGLGVTHFALTDHIEIDKFDEWDYAGAVKKSLLSESRYSNSLSAPSLVTFVLYMSRNSSFNSVKLIGGVPFLSCRYIRS